MTEQASQGDSGEHSGRGRGRPRDPEADTAILLAALELFLERGVEGTSIEQVAKRAGVGKLTVYRRWSGKEDLVAAAIESARGDIPTPSLQDLEGVSLPELIERALPVMAETLADPGTRAMIARVFGSAVSHPALMATYWERYILPRRLATRVLLERAQDEGMLDDKADIEVRIDMMVGAVMYRVVQPGPPDAREMRSYLEAVYRQAGLLPSSPPDPANAVRRIRSLRRRGRRQRR